MNSDEPLYLGLDIGGTRMTGALVDLTGSKIHVERRPTDRAGGARAGFELMSEITRVLFEHAASQNRAVRAVGIGFGGPVDSRRGVVRMSHHVEGWKDFPLAASLAERVGVPVRLDNDCNAGALGEWRFGAGRGTNDILYINLGTGIGGGVISGGRLVAGASDAAGEIGHMMIDPEGPVCTCGRRGCLEALCSGSAIGARARARAKRFPAQRDQIRPISPLGPIGPIVQKGETRLTTESNSKEVFALAAEGDPLACKIVAETADYLARAIGAAATLLNPEIVILGGGVAEVGEILLAPIRERLPRYALSFHVDELRVVRAQLGYDAGVLGAAALAMQA
jgi:glucokinase